MRFVWAVAAFVLAALLIGAGIAQRTVFQGPTTSTTEISVDSDAPYLMIDGAVLNASEGTQTLRAQAEGDIFAAYGRTVDMKAWLADTAYTSVTAADEGEVRTRVVEPAVAPEDTEEGDQGQRSVAHQRDVGGPEELEDAHRRDAHDRQHRSEDQREDG